MPTDQELQGMTQRIVAAASPAVKVILFGSYGRGDADDGSDIDLLVIEPEIDDMAEGYLRLRKAVGRMGVGVDLLLCTQRDFNRRSQVRGTVYYWAKNTGRVLYDASA
ncbi:MAG: nucleotidyltransferase domain-containing protein [Pseudomonadota bacterium]